MENKASQKSWGWQTGLKKFPSHTPKCIEFIEQRGKTDCGIACIAMLSRRLYSEIISLFPYLKKKGGLYPDDVLEALEDMGYNCRETDNLPKRGSALVALEWKDPKIAGHYVVWDSKRKQFFDPLHGVINKKEMLKFAKIEYTWRITRSQ